MDAQIGGIDLASEAKSMPSHRSHRRALDSFVGNHLGESAWRWRVSEHVFDRFDSIHDRTRALHRLKLEMIAIAIVPKAVRRRRSRMWRDAIDIVGDG